MCQRTNEACLGIAAGGPVSLPHQEPARKLKPDFDWMVVQKVEEDCGLGQEHWIKFEWAGDGRWRVEVVQCS